MWRGHSKRQREGEERKSGRRVGAAETIKELAEWCRLHQKNYLENESVDCANFS